MISLSSINQAVKGHHIGDDVSIFGVSIDSRADCSGKLFVAIKGERFDGHDYIANAEKAGAVAVMGQAGIQSKLPTVCVKDSLAALGAMAAWWRSNFEIPVVGITGSVGKTTVKEMIGSILSTCGATLITEGNFNNEIGLPLTLMKLRASDKAAVIEMGMNHAGEISRLTKICRPTVALINNAAAAHLEGLGSVAAVARAKGEIFEGLAENGAAVINADDEFAPLWIELAGNRKTILFGINKAADISAQYQLQAQSMCLQISAAGKLLEIELPLQGVHNVSNVLASVAVAHALGIDVDKIQLGLEQLKAPKGRLNRIDCRALTVIDDTYNANPASMQAAIDVLSRYEDTTLIVGEMAELGESSDSEHAELGRLADEVGVKSMLACGKSAQLSVAQFSRESKAFETQEQLLNYLQNKPILSGVALVKGSRSAQMEKVVECLIQTKTPDSTPLYQSKHSQPIEGEI